MALLIGLAICCGFIYWCYEWWEENATDKTAENLYQIGGLLFTMFLAGVFAIAGDFDVTGTLICIAIVIGCWCAIGWQWNETKKDMAKKRTDREREQKYQEQQQKWNQRRQLERQRQQDYERGNYYGTFEHTKQSLMQNKNTADYLKLGYMYENGYGTTKDYGKTMQCYQKANAWREIGYMHYFGYGVPKNKDKANEYFAKCDDIEDCKDVIEYFESI